MEVYQKRLFRTCRDEYWSRAIVPLVALFKNMMETMVSAYLAYGNILVVACHSFLSPSANCAHVLYKAFTLLPAASSHPLSCYEYGFAASLLPTLVDASSTRFVVTGQNTTSSLLVYLNIVQSKF